MSISVGDDIVSVGGRGERVGTNTIYVRNKGFISEYLDADLYLHLQTKVSRIAENNLQYIIIDEITAYKRWDEK